MTCGLDLPRLCRCGHPMGDHAVFLPHRCVAFDYRQAVLFGKARCPCVAFVPARCPNA